MSTLTIKFHSGEELQFKGVQVDEFERRLSANITIRLVRKDNNEEVLIRIGAIDYVTIHHAR